MNEMRSLNTSILLYTFLHLVRARLDNTSFEYSSQRTYIEHKHLRVFGTLSYPNSYPIALTMQDRCSAKQQVERRICLSSPFLRCIVVILYAVLALYHWQLSARFVSGLRGSINLNVSSVW